MVARFSIVDGREFSVLEIMWMGEVHPNNL